MKLTGPGRLRRELPVGVIALLLALVFPSLTDAAVDSLGVARADTTLGDAAADSTLDRAEEPLPGNAPGWASSPFLISMRSLAVPGWGQARNGAWLKSVGFLGAYAAYMGWGITLNQDVQDARGRFHAASEEDARTRLDELEALESRRNGKFWTAGFIALLAMADAYVDAHLDNFDERIDADLAVWDTGSSPAWGMTVTLAIDDGQPGYRKTGRRR